MKTRTEKFSSHKAAAAELLSQPATTTRRRGLHLVPGRNGRLMAAREDGRIWGGRRGVKAAGGKTVLSTPANLAAAAQLAATADSYFAQ